MSRYRTPGVYHERADSGPPAVAVLRTDIAGFVGLAERGPLDTPVPVGSMRQFRAWFGGFSGIGYLAYTVHAFFENGGRRCWVVRVASKDASGGAVPAGLDLRLLTAPPASAPFWRIEASSPGIWGNALRVRIQPIAPAQTRASDHDSEGARVDAVTGLARGALIRLSQPGAPDAWRILSQVDPVRRRVSWVHPDPAARLHSDRQLTSRDPDRPLWLEAVEYRLQVQEQGRSVLDRTGISQVPGESGYGPRVLRFPEPPGETDSTDSAAPPPVVIRSVGPMDQPGPLAVPDGWVPLAGGRDGLSVLEERDFLGEALSHLDSDAARAYKLRGLRTLEEIDEVALLAVPDIQIRPYRVRRTPLPEPPRDPCEPGDAAPTPVAPATELPPIFAETAVFRVQAALVEHCERRGDRIGLLDPPLAAARDTATGLGAVQAWRRRFDSSYAAFYYPWARVIDPLRGGGTTRDVPPCGHVAGQYAGTDLGLGVHKAPANAPLEWIADLTTALDDTAHGLLNPLGINAIRALPGRGLRIYGARTLSRDPQWRFVNVRRLMMMIQKAIGISLQWAVFEPNDLATRLKLRLVLTNFLTWVWQQGMLAGAVMEEAFFVQCDEDNNPPDQVEQGRLFLDVGVAPARPYEFVVVRVGRIDNSFETFTREEAADPWQS